jgi:PAS domain S-box-containing protein
MAANASRSRLRAARTGRVARLADAVVRFRLFARVPEVVVSQIVPLVASSSPRIEDERSRVGSIEQALDHAAIATFVVEVGNGQTVLSDAWYRLVGRARTAGAPEEWPPLSVSHPADRAALDYGWKQLLERQDSTPLDLEFRVVGPRGAYCWLHANGSVIARDAAGRPARIVGTVVNIDARKRAEAETRSIEARYRIVANHARGCVFEYRFDSEGQAVFLWGNASFQKLFGSAPVTAHDWRERVHPDERAAALARLDRHRSGQSTVEECRIVDTNGEMRHLRMMSTPIRGDSGEVVRVVAVAHDVTESHRMQEALEYSEFRYRTIAALTPGYAHEFRVREDGTNELVWASAGFRDVYACDHEEFNRRGGWEAFCHPDDVAASHRREQAWPSGRPTEGVARVVSLTGDIHWLRCINRPMIDPVSGRITAIVGIGHDVTALMHSYEAVRLSEERFRRAVDAMAGLVYETDLGSRGMVRWPGLQRLLGHDEHDIPATIDAWRDLVHPADVQRVVSGAAALPADDDMLEIEYRARNRDGEYEHLLDRAVILRGSAVQPIRLIGCNTNVSVRKRLERELIEISNREQQRIGNDLHDGLGQELTGVALMLRSLARRLEREHPAAIETVEHALKLVNGAIDSARTLARGLSPANLERGGLEFALQDLTTQLANMAGVAIRWRCKGGALLRLDETVANHVYRVAQEAISNALRHSGARSIDVALDVKPDRVTLRVTDDGCGVCEHDGSRGIGLKIMQYRAGIVGGTVTVRPRQPSGLEVCLTCSQPPAGSGQS